MNFGGAPKKTLRASRSEPLETMVKPCSWRIPKWLRRWRYQDHTREHATRGIDQTTNRRVGEKDSRRRAASRAKNLGPALAISGKHQASAYILLGQIRNDLQDFFLTHSGCQLFQYLLDRDSQPANTGLSAAFSRLQRNNPRIVHSDSLSEKRGPTST